MEKKKYVKPVLASEEFIPQEYIAACGDTNYEYLFKCNANGKGWFTDGGSVYEDTNKNGEWEPFNPDVRLGSYSPCQEEHKTKDGDEFLDGFLVNKFGKEVQKVKIWTDSGTNIHCTKDLDINSWEAAKS